MSENLDLVRSIFAAWERGDWGSTRWADPEIEWVFVDGPSPGIWTGVAGMAEASRDWINAWEDYRAEAEEYRELDNERVLVLIRLSGRGKLSGMKLEQMRARGAGVMHIRGGKVTRVVTWWERDRALADLGLKE
jgi:ketosteroid isomerase-like protein